MRDVRSESYSGCNALSNARGNVVLAQDEVTFFAPPPAAVPSLAFLFSLIDYVYAAAAQTSVDAMSPVPPSGLTEVGRASIALDTVRPIAIVWTLDTDPTVGYLIFRGTVGTYEWLIDGYYTQVPYVFAAQEPPVPSPPTAAARVHSGFADAYASGLGSDLRGLVIAAGIKRLYIAGHSLGGALAVLAAADLAGLHAPTPAVVSEVRLWTAGAPRVGNPIFAEAFDTLRVLAIPWVLQVRSEDDLVPTTPLPVMIDPVDSAVDYLYEHVGDVTYFRNPQPSVAASHSMANYITFARGIVPAVSVPPPLALATPHNASP